MWDCGRGGKYPGRYPWRPGRRETHCPHISPSTFTPLSAKFTRQFMVRERKKQRTCVPGARLAVCLTNRAVWLLLTGHSSFPRATSGNHSSFVSARHADMPSRAAGWIQGREEKSQKQARSFSCSLLFDFFCLCANEHNLITPACCLNWRMNLLPVCLRFFCV